MRTIETIAYQFSELSDEAKRRALFDFEPFTQYIYADAYKTVKAFCKVFGVKEGSNSWLEVNTYLIDNNILELTGERLRKYLINNFYTDIFTPKVYRLNGKQRKSKIFVTNDCTLTGVCYDYSILEPIIKFIEKPCKHTNFKDLMNECFKELEKDINNEIEYRYTDEAKTEDIESNGYEFDENGKMI
jgi:Fe-S cluster biosynthesis and repair protein YggX